MGLWSEIAYSVAGIGYAKEMEQARILLSRARNLPEYKFQNDLFEIETTTKIAKELANEEAIFITPAIYTKISSIDAKFGNFIKQEIAAYEITKSLPSGNTKDRLNENVKPYIEQLKRMHCQYMTDLDYCIGPNKIIDIERLNNIKHIADVASHYGIPGAIEMQSASLDVARHLYASLPDSKSKLPDGYKKVALSDDLIRIQPVLAAEKILASFLNIEPRRASLDGFSKKFHDAPPSDGSSFKLCLEKMHQTIVQDLMQKFKVPNLSQIALIETELSNMEEKIYIAHQNDIKIANGFEPNDEVSRIEVEAAIGRITARNSSDLMCVASVADKWRQFKISNARDEIAANPIKHYSENEIKVLLPPVQNHYFSVELDEYIKYLRDTVKSTKSYDMANSLKKSGTLRDFLSPIGKDSAYLNKAETISTEIDREYRLAAVDSAFKEDRGLNIFSDKRKNTIREHVELFEKYQKSACSLLENFWDASVTQGKIDRIAGVIESIKTACPETHAHCANLIIYALDHNPSLKLEKTIQSHKISISEPSEILEQSRSLGPRMR